MARPNWEWIRVDVLLPENPKLDELPPATKWLLIEMWCYCGRNHTDGLIRHAKWKTFGTPSARKQLIAAGLVDADVDGWVMHDFTGPDGHQRSKAEIDELAEKRADKARNAANARWGKDKPPLAMP
jgi:hypothetical protein